MSKFCSWRNVGPTLSAAEIWKEKCLRGHGSILSDKQLWLPQYLGELEKHYVDNPDGGRDDFLVKFERQLESASDEVKQLSAEILWILFLFTHVNIGPDSKRDTITRVWGWSGSSLNQSHPMLRDDVLLGIGKSGTAFNTLRHAELVFCIQTIIAFKRESASKQQALVEDPWLFGEWIGQLDGQETRQFRHMLSFFLFPDYYEGCCSRGDKQAILSKLDNRPLTEVKNMDWLSIDKALYELRTRLTKETGNGDFTFYDEPYVSQWRGGEAKVLSVKEQGEKYRAEQGEKMDSYNKEPRNLILHGPPGTGKTYNSINYAVALCKGVSVEEVVERDKEDHASVKAEYDALREAGRITFTTFHQSMSYEDFVEGIKPQQNDNGGVYYEVVDGIFKQICRRASLKTIVEENTSAIDLTGRRYWKMSLGNTAKAEDEDIYSECIENNYVLLGWGWTYDYSMCGSRDEIFDILRSQNITNDKSDYEVTAIYTFAREMSVGDLVIVSDGNRKFRAIAEITGEYEPLKDADRDHYRQKRSVKWLRVYDPAQPTSALLHKYFSQKTIYELRYALDHDKLKGLLSGEPGEEKDENAKPHVLVIDEINRGNVSAILGELITLLEPDKRLGMGNALRVTLPYSQESDFGVPPNLHIIGTMNTADRSVEALDTALRRRFTFKEMMPDSSLLNEPRFREQLDDEVETIAFDKMLDVINQRLEVLVGRDHTIGHAFFMGLKTLEALKQVFHSKVIPQLQEYFYGDWEKIYWVLGEKFVIREQAKNISWPGRDMGPDDVDGRDLWRITDPHNWDSAAFQSIYDVSGENAE